MKLSTLSILIGSVMALPQIYGLLKPAGFAAAVRKFPRYTPIGYVLVGIATIWFLYNLNQESVADFASMKPVLFVLFAGVGLGTCLFVQDFLLVRGEKKLTVSLNGCRMRNYVADAPITRLNTNAIIQATACIDKNEQPFNETFK